MRVLKFNLSGQTAFFKKPDVNSYCYFTYGNIHKIAIMGILGCCLGLDGYTEQKRENSKQGNKIEKIYPDFYEKLNGIKVSIVPKNNKGYINKKVQIFNNSVGYASKEEGGNLIIKEQWLEKPSWDIFVLIEDKEICKEIQRRFESTKFVYIPYLGKNDHIANISQIEIIDDAKITQDVDKMDSLIIKDKFSFAKDNDFLLDFDEEDKFKYQEKLPYKLEEITNQYILETFLYTNMRVSENEGTDILKVGNLNLFFM